MKRLMGYLGVAICALGISACGGSDPGPSTTGPSPSSSPQDSFPLHAAPIFSPPFLCGPQGPATVNVMQRLNAFWQSNVIACSCQTDAFLAGCSHNAMVPALGYIFYDAAFLTGLDGTAGSPLPADFFMAHEFGHNVQLQLGLAPIGKNRELQADCLGGYFVGNQIRHGASQSEVLTTFTFACQIGDPFASPWWQTGAHGTCPERVSALQLGIAGYLNGLLPGQACPT